MTNDEIRRFALMEIIAARTEAAAASKKAAVADANVAMSVSGREEASAICSAGVADAWVRASLAWGRTALAWTKVIESLPRLEDKET